MNTTATNQVQYSTKALLYLAVCRREPQKGLLTVKMS